MNLLKSVESYGGTDMQYNYVNIIIVVILLFGLGVVLSRVGGISGIVRKIRKAFRWLRGYKD